jgi:hypothetical protein
VCGGTTSEPLFFGPFRLHHGCHPLLSSEADRVAAAVHRLALDPDLTITEARLLPVSVPSWMDTDDADPTDQRTRLPWSHLDRRRLRRALRGLPAARREAGLDDSTCVSGACAWCGRSRSRGWHGSDYTWPDGTSAPLCTDCHRVWVAHSEPQLPDDVAAALAEAITGVPTMLGEAPPPLTMFCEAGNVSSDICEHEEVSSDLLGAEPWSHLPAEAVDRLRWARWGRFGGRDAPAEHRAEAVARAEAEEAVRAARNASEAADQAVRADVYGFGADRSAR